MPISSRQELRDWLAADARANGVDGFSLPTLLRRPPLRFILALRVAEWLSNTARTPFGRAAAAGARAYLLRTSVRVGIEIPCNVCGPGLALPHWGSIVVSGYAAVGADVRIHSGVNIAGTPEEAPVIGDGCYLGPGAKLIGAIKLGEGCIVGANAVVTSSFEPGTVVAGVPARALRMRGPDDRPDQPLWEPPDTIAT